MTMETEEISMVDELAKRVYDMASYNANKDDVQAQTIPEFMACEVIDLAEWMSPDADTATAVAEKVIEIYTLPSGTAALVKKYFELGY